MQRIVKHKTDQKVTCTTQCIVWAANVTRNQAGLRLGNLYTQGPVCETCAAQGHERVTCSPQGFVDVTCNMQGIESVTCNMQGFVCVTCRMHSYECVTCNKQGFV